MSLTKVRMLVDYPRGAKGRDVLFRKGAIREVDPERAARLVDDKNAELLPDGWTPEAEAAAAAPKGAAARRGKGKDG